MRGFSLSARSVGPYAEGPHEGLADATMESGGPMILMAAWPPAEILEAAEYDDI
jgi:hypothetical protein